jgi:two-component system phosphate regulon sensor histidine kinase PhoR
MIVCAIVVIVFQFYWINSLYKNEKNVISKTTNALFKETVYEIQDRQTLRDTAFLTKAINDFQHLKVIGDDASKIASEVWHQLKLGLKIVDEKQQYESKKMIEGLANSIKDNAVLKNIIKDSIQKKEVIELVLPIDDIKGLYKNKLTDSENDIDLPFEVFVSENAIPTDSLKSKSNFVYTDIVAIGQQKKISYYAAITSFQSHILHKIIPQLIISIGIIIFFIASIFFAYKTLSDQKQLVIAKNDLISNITHEFKTPITTISVAIEAITKFGVIDDKELTKEYLQVSTDELNRLNLLVDKVLKLSLFENGKTELKTEKVNINSLIEDVIANMKPQFDKHNALVNFKSDSNIDITADKSHIKSVVYNLIDNAIKYCERQPIINIDLRQVDDIAEIIVQDNGIGIAPQHQSKIFDKFYRVPQGNTHNAKGYGLGLSYISHIVKMHNGYINVTSALGKGSRFIVGIKNVNSK